MMLDALLAFGIVMSFSTQISLPGLPMTIGEFALFLWITIEIARILTGGRVVFSSPLARIGGFWIAWIMLLCIGAAIGHLTKILFANVVIHDALAYVLVALLTCLAAAQPDAYHRLRRCAWFVVAGANISLAVQVCVGWGLLPRTNLGPWFWDRFQGWSKNPNQLALHCAVFGPLALHLATTSKRAISRLAGFMGILLPFYVGRLTKSDTYLLTTALTCIVFVGLRLRTWLTIKNAKATPGRQIAILLLIFVMPLGVSLLPYAASKFGSAESFAISLTKDKGGDATEATASLRLQLWDNAIEAGLRAGSLGLGPGPHLDRPPITKLGFLPIPFEAHNTVLDIFTQAGLTGVILLMWIIGSAGWLALRAKLDALFALIVSIGVFSMPHLIIRYPTVWFAITFCLVAGAGAKSITPRGQAPALTKEV